MKLTVAILSYNRPKELRRCLSSLIPMPEGVEIVVFDDASPMRTEIIGAVADVKAIDPAISLKINPENLGYDGNLVNAVVASAGEHVMLLSDDDFLEKGCLVSVLGALRVDDPACAFVRFLITDNLHSNSDSGEHYVRRRDLEIATTLGPDDLRRNGAVIYNSILFSGLIFKRRLVHRHLETLQQFRNSIYTQVAIFALLTNEFGARFIPGPGVVACGDGANGFGSNSSASNDGDLVDRTTVHSNLKFNRRLIEVIYKLSLVLGSAFSKSFFREYNFRNFSGMRIARNAGRRSLARYWQELGEITHGRGLFHWAAYLAMLILPIAVVNDITRVAYSLVGRRGGAEKRRR
jgi:glycosyltransferase involved in cell wall biosynthesis